jgi:Uncharacterized conserved protein (COG2071)
MTAKTVACTIERRLLVNYRIEPELVARLLPRPFRPQLVSGLAVGGVCFIRLGGLRAGHLPRVPWLVSENAAHRFAVEGTTPTAHRPAYTSPGVTPTPGSPRPPEARSSPAPTGSPASGSTNPAARCASTSPPATARYNSRSPPPRRVL